MSGPVQRQSSRERLRGPYLKIFTKFEDALTFDRALKKADAENRVFPSNARLTEAMIQDGWLSILEAFPCRTGTLVAYTKPGEALGNAIEIVDRLTEFRWVFPVPGSFSKNTDCVVLVEHPNFTIEADGNNRVVHVKLADLTVLNGFPESDGYYRGDPVFDIPVGPTISKADPNARYLRRNSKQICPAVCGFQGHHNDAIRRYVDMAFWPSFPYGDLVEATQNEIVGSISELILNIIENTRSDLRLYNESCSKPEIRKQVIMSINELVEGFKQYGSGCSTLLAAGKALGEFVTIELQKYPHIQGLVPELKRYFLQRMAEVKEVQK